MRRKEAELAALDREVERHEALTAAPAESVHAAAVRDLVALGVPDAPMAWALGVVTSRVWLLEIAKTGDWEAWHLWRFCAWMAENIRNERVRRKFGSSGITRADLEEARLRLAISDERFVTMRSVAAWVLRDFEAMRRP